MRNILCRIFGHKDIELQMMGVIGWQMFYKKSMKKTKIIQCVRCRTVLTKIAY